jgi:hypothetical protein
MDALPDICSLLQSSLCSNRANDGREGLRPVGANGCYPECQAPEKAEAQPLNEATDGFGALDAAPIRDNDCAEMG